MERLRIRLYEKTIKNAVFSKLCPVIDFLTCRVYVTAKPEAYVFCGFAIFHGKAGYVVYSIAAQNRRDRR